MDSLTLEPIAQVAGDVTIPGSKSLSNRILLLASLARGETRIRNLLDSDDVRHMLTALQALGVAYAWEGEPHQSPCVVQGCDGPLQVQGACELFLGNAGTAMRPLAAALCLGAGDYVLRGEPRMYERPIEHLVDALRPLGAEITYLDESGFPPLRIRGTGLRGGHTRIDGSISSQFLTALLMASPLAAGDVDIAVMGELVSKPYIDITLHLMRRFGVTVDVRGDMFRVPGRSHYKSPGDILVEGDASSASYFLAAAAIKGGPVTVHGVGRNSVQGDIRFVDVLEQMGAEVKWQADAVEVRGTGSLHGLDIDLNHIPDAAMTIATTALFADGPTTIRNIYNWRVKETDRLAAMATELRKVGADVEEGKDYIHIVPPNRIQAAAIDTYDDHRMAMCFSLAALGDSAITINDPGCTAKTFPTYFELFESLAMRA